MAKITTGATFGLNARQAQACRMMAEGRDEHFVLLVLWGVDTHNTQDAENRKNVARARRELRKWQQLPQFSECYRAIVREIAFPAFGKAVQTVVRQMDSDMPWLANKAANDVFTRFGPAIMGEEDKAVAIRIEGMPTLGTPSGEELLIELPPDDA